jgi:hypothetical protein
MPMKHFATALAAAVLPVALAGCPGGAPQSSVSIAYKQIGACNGFATPNGLVSAGVNQAYVLFAVERIDNTGNAAPFAYDPGNIGAIVAGHRDAFDSGLQLYKFILGPFATAPMTVAAGQTISFSPFGFGALIVQTMAADGASEADHTAYFLTYQGSGNPLVVMTNTDASRTSWPYTPDCSTVSPQ